MQLYKSHLIIFLTSAILSGSLVSMDDISIGFDGISQEVPTQVASAASSWFNEKWTKTKKYWNSPKITVEQNGEADLSLIKNDVIKAFSPTPTTPESISKVSSHKEIVVGLMVLAGLGFVTYKIIDRILVPYYRKITNKSNNVDNNEMVFTTLEQGIAPN